MVAPAPPSAQLSYAERAKRAQNIRSPIAAPPPPKNILSTVHVVVDTTSSSSAASAASTTATTSTTSTEPSSATVSSSLSTSANDTPNSSVALATRASSPIPASTSFSTSHNIQNSSKTAAKNEEKQEESKSMSSSQLAEKALSIVAAHTSNTGVSKPAPTPNVWSQRIERMSAARAATVASTSSQTSNFTPNAPSGTPPTVISVAASAAAGATPAPALGSTLSLSSSSATATPVASSHSDARVLKAASGKPRTNQIVVPPSEGDPFVVRPPAQRLTPAWAAGTSLSLAAPPPTSSSSNASISVSMTPSTSSLGPAFSATPSISAEAWPEVGKSVITTSTSTTTATFHGNATEEEHGSGAGEQDADGGSDGKGAKSKKGKSKSKWVQIPPAELQAAADAAAAATRKANSGHSHSQGPRKGNKGSTANSSGNTNADNTNGTNTSAHNTPRSHSGRTSAVQSRIHSAQNSPRAQRGRRLPLEEGPLVLGLDTAGPPPPVPADAAIAFQSPPPQQQPETHTPPFEQPQSIIPPQPRYSATPFNTTHIPVINHGSPAPNAPGTPPYPGPDQVYTAQHHRHRSHPMQPAIPPVPAPASSPHSFQASASPFYPQAHHLHGDLTSPLAAAAFQASSRPSIYPPLHGGYGPPPMYPMYPPPAFGFGGWQPPSVYGPMPPVQPGYVPMPYGDGQPAPSSNILSADESAVGNDVVQAQPEARLDVEKELETIPDNPGTSSSPREKMMFGSIVSAVQRASSGGDASPTLRRNGPDSVKVNGEASPREEKAENIDEQTQASAKDSPNAKEGSKKDTKAKTDRKPKTMNGSPTEREKDGTRSSAGKHVEGTIPAVQAAQGAQAEIKWKFGTASNTPPVQRQQALPPADEDAQHAQHQVIEPPSALQASNSMPTVSSAHSNRTDGNLSLFPPPLDPRGSASFTHLPPALPLPPLLPVGPVSPQEHGLSFGDTLVPSLPSAETEDSDLDVKDYGYGFGDASGSGYAMELAREERLAREREFEAEREREREMAAWREENQKALVAAGVVAGPGMEDGHLDENVVAPEAGPSHSGYREPGSWRGGPHGGEGPRGGRRGGGAFGTGPGGRGYGGSERGYSYGGRRGRGTNGYSRGYGRGYGRGGGGATVPHRTPPFTVTPPQHLRALAPVNDLHQPGVGAPYYPPPRQMGASYLAPPLPPTGFDGYGPPPPLPAVNGAPPVPQLSPPVPVPLSPISFPLDATRYYLLGQLEYYLSPQNMVQDFFLRQQMDARGWVPIPLIASFNRVKQLTMDVHFVRDVLTLSSLVQVRGSMVRMGGWEQFVLPDAAPSSVEDQPLPQAYQNLGSYPNEHLGRQYPYEQNNQNQNLPQNQQGHQLFRDTESSTPTQTEGTERRNGVVSHVNGHSAKAADASHLDEEEDEEEDEEDVVFVMGHEVGTWSPERGT